MWNKLDNARPPETEGLAQYIGSPLWQELLLHMEKEYGLSPKLEYSACSMQQGWNLKFKKGGRSLCTVYPMEGFFIALVVIGEKEKAQTELVLPGCTPYLQKLYRDTPPGQGARWLMIHVTSPEILADMYKLIAIRSGRQK